MITSEPGQKGKDEFFTIYHSIVYHRRTLERETMYMLYYVISIYWQLSSIKNDDLNLYILTATTLCKKKRESYQKGIALPT